MKISELAYRCIKEAFYMDDSGFTLEHYKDGTYYESAEYGVQINNVFSPINEAIARLNDLDKISYRVVEIPSSAITKDDDVYIADLSFIDNLTQDDGYIHEFKEVVNVAIKRGIGFRKLETRPFGRTKILLGKDFNNLNGERLFIEYKEDIPYFTEKDGGIYPYNQETTDIDIELKDYGVTNSMCPYIMEYAMAKLSEDIDPSLSNMHLTRAEQYFSNIKSVTMAFKQNNVYKTYKIGE